MQSYVMNLSAVAAGEPPIHDFSKYINWSFVADGLVGGVEPNVVFYFPIMDNYTTSWSQCPRSSLATENLLEDTDRFSPPPTSLAISGLSGRQPATF